MLYISIDEYLDPKDMETGAETQEEYDFYPSKSNKKSWEARHIQGEQTEK